MFQAACCCNMHRFECSQLETDVENRLFGKLYDEKSSIKSDFPTFRILISNFKLSMKRLLTNLKTTSNIKLSNNTFWFKVDNGGIMKCPKKHVKDIFFTWWLMQFFEMPHFIFGSFSLLKLITCIFLKMPHFFMFIFLEMPHFPKCISPFSQMHFEKIA